MLGAVMCAAHQKRSSTRKRYAPSGAHLKHQPAAWSNSLNEQCERARRARGRLPRLIESKNGPDRRGGSRERACAGVRRFGQSSHPSAAGPCKPRGHMRIHAVKVQPPAALGDPYPSLSSGCHKVIRFYSGRSGLRRARARRSLGAEEVDKAARGRTPVYGGASGCFTLYGAQPGPSPRQLSRRLTRAIVRSPRGRRTAAGVGEALLSALPPWRRGAWCGMTEPGVLARKPVALPVRTRARHNPLALLHLTPAEVVWVSTGYEI